MNKLSYLTISLTITAAIIGMAVGYFISPEYQQSMYVKEEMGLGTADRWLDLRYINKMIAHHRGAILVAQQARRESKRPEIQNLAKEILNNEPKLITELYAWKSEWYQDTRQVKDPIVPNLGAYDETWDLRFLNAVIAHHEAGIVMTKEARLKTARKEIMNNADAVENFLQGSIITLKEWRTEWYNLN